MEGFIPYKWTKLNHEQQLVKSREFYREMESRRSVRAFSQEEVSKEAILNAVKTAGTAPSGAHKQPWTFCLISNPEIKRKIRLAAEEEEKLNYTERMSETWLEDLKKFGTNWEKPFLERAPYLIVIFKKAYDRDESGKKQNYYVNESVGLAAGFLLAALHRAGLHTLTHTPSPMNFLTEILERPANERPFLLIPVGYPSSHLEVPNLQRKTLNEILVEY
ncbi:MAG: nitroreductase family protein [Vicingaceae bacterium]